MKENKETSDPPFIFSLDLDTFLRGPNAIKPLDVDIIFGTSFQRVMQENYLYENECENLMYLHAVVKSKVVPGVVYGILSYGVFMFSPTGTIVGCYIWATLAIANYWQGRGLGRELVIQRMLFNKTNPVWDLDVPAYSPAGLATHISAWRSMQGDNTCIEKPSPLLKIST